MAKTSKRTPTIPKASAKPLIMNVPLIFRESRAPAWAPNTAPIPRKIINVIESSKLPLTWCTMVPLNDVMAKTKCDVAVAK